MMREYRVVKNDLKEARSRHLVTISKFEKDRDAEIARLRKANEIETKRKLEAIETKRKLEAKESALRAQAEAESKMRLGTDRKK